MYSHKRDLAAGAVDGRGARARLGLGGRPQLNHAQGGAPLRDPVAGLDRKRARTRIDSVRSGDWQLLRSGGEDQWEGRQALVEEFPEIPEPPFFIYQVGTMGAGKTTLGLSMLNVFSKFSHLFDELHIVSGTVYSGDPKLTAMARLAKERGIQVKLWKSMTPEFYADVLGDEFSDRKKLIFIDDLSGSGLINSMIPIFKDALTQSRHVKVGVMISGHNFKGYNSHIREIATHIIIRSMPPRAMQDSIAKETVPDHEEWEDFVKRAINEALTSGKKDYIVVARKTEGGSTVMKSFTHVLEMPAPGDDGSEMPVKWVPIAEWFRKNPRKSKDQGLLELRKRPDFIGHDLGETVEDRKREFAEYALEFEHARELKRRRLEPALAIGGRIQHLARPSMF